MASCVQCGREFLPTIEGQLRCAECEQASPAEHGQAEPAQERTQQLPTSFYFHSPTIILIALNVIMFLIVSIRARSILNPDAQILLRLGANYGPYTLGDQPWRLFSSMFLHGGLIHLVLNMWALLNLGVLAEILFGRRSYLLMYLACGLGGSIASCWWHAGVIGVGASGAIFGIAGALLPALAFQKNKRMRAVLRGNLGSIAFFVLYNILFGAAAARVDNAAHLGGLVTGVILGALLPSSPGITTESHPKQRFVVFAGAIVVLAGTYIGVKASRIAYIDFAKAEDAFRARNYKRAIDFAQKSLQKRPDFVSAHYLLGTIYLDSGNGPQAVKELSRTVELRPEFADAHSQLCVARLRTGDVKGAFASCNRAVELDPQDPDDHFNLGLVQRVAGDPTAAIQSFKKAVELKPNGFDENYYLGISLEDVHDSAAAVAPLEKAVSLKPLDADARRALIRTYLAVGRRHDAERVAQGK